ncbi:MAG: DUF2059 domain-containing protein [Candidatus Omnitrophica bacterium]|nr:DUF2059 domain-containing protein [Candidatus Omnitrophota bacterium]
MKKFLILSVSMFILYYSASIVFAETVYLKNGRVVTGVIVEKTERQIKIEANGLLLTYYLDEIERIGDGASSSEQVVAVPKKTKSLSGDSKNLALRYMEAAGVKENMRKTFDNVIAQSPEEDRDKLAQAFNVEDIVLQLVPIYEKYFSDKELQDLINFYESPTGRKVLEVNPMILQDSMDVSYKYFQGKLE